MKLASQASALECRGELGVCVMVFVVKAHDARLAQLIHNFLKYLLGCLGYHNLGLPQDKDSRQPIF